MGYKVENILQNVVNKTNIDLALEQSFSYEYGQLTEVNEIIQEFVNSSQRIFPLVWFVFNYTKSRGTTLEDKFLFDYSTDISVFLINTTDKRNKTKNSMSENINPRLLPYAEKFVENLQNSDEVRKVEGGLDYKITELSKVGSESTNTNKFIRTCDAVLIEFRNLQIKNSNCTENGMLS